MGRITVLAPPLPSSEQDAAYEEITTLLLAIVWRQLDRTGLRLTGDGWRESARARPLYARWLDETERLLRRHGYPAAGAAVGDLDALWARWERYRTEGRVEQAGLVKQADLVQATLEALPDILTGRRRATDVLFPGASMSRVEAVYKNNPQADYFNGVLAQRVASLIEARRAYGHTEPLHILEIGAGTGGTSEVVFEALRPLQDLVGTYTYTDVSKAFLLHAEDAYGAGRPYLRYRLLDIQQPLEAQGLSLGTYDIVIAANVLHATTDIRTTLRHTKAALKRNGALLINEIVAKSLFAHLTFGLTEGWWLVEDPELRIEGCPALSIDGWNALLTEEGFDRVRWPAAEASALGQQIIMARSDGVIRPASAHAKKIAPSTEARRPEAQAPVPREPVNVDDDALADEVRRAIAAQLSINLRVPISQIGYHDAFGDYGVDSISGVRLIQQLNGAFGIRLETTHLYDFSSIQRLAEHMLSAWGPELRARRATNDGGRAAASEPRRASSMNGGAAIAAFASAPDASGSAASHAREPAAASTVSSQGHAPSPEPAYRREPIAVIGMSGRFAEADDLDALWRHLAAGADLVRPVTRWRLPEQTATGEPFCRHGGLLNGIDRFDPLFFNISVTEATTMDPQQRFFLEEAWKALEDGGYAGDGLSGSRCGVYVGYNVTDYQTLLGEDAPPQAMWGNAGSILSARISYYLNLQGPAITVDTACSSALVATHLACQGLWNHETEMALAGGAFLQTTPGFYLLAGRAGMLSPSGRCYTFDARADGFVPGEGVGVVLLKRLCDAIADGDHIHGVICGSGVNQDGNTNGITAPSALSQERLERQVYDTFGIHAESIQLVEAHGTGTKLGDPVEFRALTSAFRKDTSRTRFCAVDSIKTNIGHTAAAAGIAGLLKVLLALRHRQLPPAVHYAQPNPAIDFEASPFYVNTTLTDWGCDAGKKRRAAVSSFGFSGTNAHLVVEEADPVRRPERVERPGHLLVLSARTQEQLRTQVRNLLDHVAARPHADLGDVCFTLMVGRKRLAHRLACVSRSLDELVGALGQWIESESAPGVLAGHFKDNESRERPSLRRYGNQCILECRRGEVAGRDYIERLEVVGDLFVQGYALDYADLFAPGAYRRVPLPTYPFAREAYWVKARGRAGAASALEGATQAERATTLLALPAWRAQPAAGDGARMRDVDFAAHRVLIAGELPEAALRALREQLPRARCEVVAPREGSLAQRYERAAVAALRSVRLALEEGGGRSSLVQLVVATGGDRREACFAGLSGLLKTASRENPRLATQTLELGDAGAVDVLPRALLEDARDVDEPELLYRDGRRWVRRLERAARLDDPRTIQAPWRDGGVYLITGGLGGLGYLFATAIAESTRGSTLVLVHRSAPSGEQRARLDALRSLGARVDDQRRDVGDARDVDGLIEHVRASHGALTGVLHAAGTTRDALLPRKTPEEVNDVLRPKVAGLVHLDEATRDLPLDHFVCFSAFAGVYGNPGQADYAAANAFMDAYVEYRRGLVEEGRRHGTSLAIAWPLWADGGMKMTDAGKARMHAAGLRELDTRDGLAACSAAVARKSPRVVVLTGDEGKLEAFFEPSSPRAPRRPEPTGGVAREGASLLHATLARLKELLAVVTTIEAERIDGAEPFEAYGLDSIMITQLNQRLEAIFGAISKTLFFEHRTLEGLAQHLAEEHREACQRWAGGPGDGAPDDVARAEPRGPSSAAQEARSGERAPAEAALPAQELDVAIIGLAGRYPHARTLDEFWENLRAGKDCITEVPPDRWPIEGFYDGAAESSPGNGKSYSKWGGFLEGFADFDPLFFGISPGEAESLDPQERSFLEICWEVIEDAGYTRRTLQSRHGGRVGVYAGITKTGFDLYGPALWATGKDAYPHTSFSSLANRVSYLFDLRGPSIPVDTMCSASLTAIHEACEHLKRGECELAIAGGVNLYLHPSNYVILCSHRMLSPDGKCRSFGAGANGYVPGEGVGAVLLKLLRRAEADGDHIYGVIKGTAINHGGRTHGYTVPNPNAQAEVVAMALARARIDARAVSYIEAHGTGTELGDPIEITGLTKAFRASAAGPLTRRCAIGSLKSNIGHAESAAGIAGVTKVLLQMKHGQLVPSLHARTPNPNIDFDRTPFVVQQELESWGRLTQVVDGRTEELPRIAGISSFGAGGANAHVVIQEYAPAPEEPSADGEQPPAIIVLSARTEAQLAEQARNLLRAIRVQRRTDGDLARIAWTLQTGREAMEERLACVASSLDELVATLGAFVASPSTAPGIYRGSARKRKDVSAFAANEELREVVSRWIERRRYAQLLELWVSGLEVDWEQLYGERKPRRISLPTYPFERERYWLPQGEGAVVAGAASPVEASGAAAGGGRLEQGPGPAEVSRVEAGEAAEVVEYEEAWERLGWEERERHQEGVRWVVVGGDEAWRASVVEALRREEPGSEALGVSVGGAYGWEGSARCTVPEASEVWFRSVFEQLGARDGAHGGGGRPCGVVYAWGRGLERLRGVHALVRGAKGSGALLRRLVLTGRQVRGEVSGCYDAALIGVERSLGLVLPELSVGVVLGGAEGIEAGALAREVWSGGVIRHEGGERQRLGVRRALPSGRSEAPLRDGGVYVITGGAGGLGRLFAEHLARRCAGRLALVGRRGRDEQIEGVLSRLRGAGAREAEYYEADVSDAAQMRCVVEALESRWGSIHGVLHAAGVESGGALLDKRWEEVEEITRPKMEGTRVVDEVTAGHPLDFMCLFSSTAAVLGDGGSCDYASANRFQVAYAQMRQELRERGERSGATVAVCWPLWRAGGMGTAEREGMAVYLRSSGQRYLESDEGLGAWERAMGAAVSPRLVFAGQPRRVHAFLSRIYAGARADGASTDGELTRGAPPRRDLPARPAGAPSTSTAERVLRDLKSCVEAVLKVPASRLSEDTSFADIGFDSIGLTRVARLLSKHFGFEIVPSVFFSYTTLEKFCGHLLEQHRDALERLYESALPPDPGAARAPARDAHGSSDDSAAVAAEPGREPEAQRLHGARAASASRPALAPSSPDEPVAIIGMSARAAGAGDVDELWQLLIEGRTHIEDIPGDRWDARPYYAGPGAPGNRIVTNKGGFIRGLDRFDPLFFEISPREAQSMDPRQRLMLQEAWRAFEDAGYAGDALRGTRAGVFVGVEEGVSAQDGTEGLATSHHNAILAARISYVLDLRGPNLAINTACSSGLVALHTACQSVRRGECSMALVGAVNVLASPLMYVALSQGGMLSADGECYAFDQRANGLVPGEAAVAVVVKRLSQAITDGDTVLGVIRASGVNYDGRTNGLTAPSGLAQASLLEEMYQDHAIDVEDITYIIAHGTGTKLGDPVEVNSLMDVFGRRTSARGFCAVGSVKPNFGHTFAASGLVSLVAMLMAMRHRQIPPSANHAQNNEFIDFAKGAFYVNDRPRAWLARGGAKRLGAISAFGMSGTNAHVVIEEHVPEAAAAGHAALPAGAVAIVPLSARRVDDLVAYAESLRAFLADGRRAGAEAPDLASVAYTLQTGREAMRHRAVFCVRDLDELESKLRAYAAAGPGRGADDRDADELAARWARGEAVDWRAMVPGARPVKTRLPTYPFHAAARLSSANGSRELRPPAERAAPTPRALHPLVHRIVSV
ncbi:SDR family NAD(P)-dependent oxidoreductase [Sorangium cellulosum]|uniref:SDR family NAD(P)-dependent oxidoreductase n=1 Tax=Sorangium cellulosum TaxID=56 RepID=UPI0012FFCCE5|nr:SDR family NAD(P)-dependent oxidoreductase [Sorangium cellulosum]